MKKIRKRGWLDARHQARRFAALVRHSTHDKASMMWAALCGVIIAAAIGGMYLWAGGMLNGI